MQAKVVDLCRPRVVAAACRGDSGEVHQTVWRGMMDGGGDARREKHRWIGWTRRYIGPLTWAVPWTGYCSDAPHSSVGPTPQQAVLRLIPAQVPGYPPHAGSPRYGRDPEQYYPRYRHGTLPYRAISYSATGPWTNHIQIWPREGGFGPSSPLATGFFPAMTPPRIARGPLDSPGRL